MTPRNSAALGILLALMISGPTLRAEPDELLKVANDLGGEAEVIEDEDFQTQLRLRAAELYRMYADQTGGERSASALLKACDLYVKIGHDEALSQALVCAMLVAEKYGNSKLAPGSQVLKGEIYARKKEWGRAVRTWIACADKHAATSNAPAALYRAGQVLQKNIKNPAEAAKQYGRVVTNYPTADVTDDSLFARAGIFADDKKFEEAVSDYLAVAKTFPAGELADKAMYEAAVLCDEDLKDYRRAYNLAVEFRQAFPHSALQKKMDRIESKTLKYVKDS